MTLVTGCVANGSHQLRPGAEPAIVACDCGASRIALRAFLGTARRLVDVADLRDLITASTALATHLRSSRCDAVLVPDAFLKRIEGAIAKVECGPCRGRGKRRDDGGEDAYGFIDCPECAGTGVAA